MAAYILVDMTIHDKDGYSTYPPLAWPIIEKHGGKVTHRISDFETVEGGWLPKRVVIIEFPNREAAAAFINDPDYVPVKDIRLKTAESAMVLGSAE
jgi:uncharacterized protein (DUF1330 family)